jgi:hypothetical protein
MAVPQSSNKTKMEFYTVDLITTDQVVSMPVAIPITLLINKNADKKIEMDYISNIIRSIREAWLKQIKYLPYTSFHCYFKIGKEHVSLAELVTDTTRYCIYSRIQGEKQNLIVRDNKTGQDNIIIANVNYSFRRIIEFEAIRNPKNPKKNQFAIKILNREKQVEILRTPVCNTEDIIATRAFKMMNEITLKMTKLDFDWLTKIMLNKLDLVRAYTGLYPFYLLQLSFNSDGPNMNLQYLKTVTDMMDIVDYNIKEVEASRSIKHGGIKHIKFK